MKKILLIDDSALMRRVISDIINSNEDYEVAAVARDGVEGFEMIVSNPNLYSAVILDINMPKMNGLELLRELQKNHIEQTVIVVSTVAKEGARETIQALEYGAFDFITKPENYLETKGDSFKKKISDMLDAATHRQSTFVKSELKARTVSQVHRGASTGTDSVADLRALRERNARSDIEKPHAINTEELRGLKRGRNKLVAIACSTGGPKSLQQVIPYLPKELDAGVLLVQHMPKGFTKSLAQRLDELSEISVKEAEDGEIIRKGCVYIAPGGQHMKALRRGNDYIISISDEPPVDGLRPCANIMYTSLKDCNYDELTCVVLTGMGSDGTNGIRYLSENRKAMHVIAQDEDSSVVYGMPRAIEQAGLVDEVVPLNQVAAAITKNVGVS